jgi:hypothetical protein
MPEAEELTVCSGDSVLIDAGEFLSYLWNTGDTTRTIAAHVAGEYYVEVTDQFDNLISSYPLIITNGDVEILGVVSVDPPCHGVPSGEVEIVSDQSDLFVEWSDGFEGLTRQNLLAGEYHYVITNTAGCSDSGLVLLVEPDPLFAVMNPISATCHGAADGSVLVEVSGGTEPYIVEIEGDSFTGLSAGVYAIEITDGNECVLMDSVDVAEPLPLNLTISVTDAICYGENNGSVMINPSGGTPPYTINFAGTLSNLYAGEYPVEIEDAHGCLKDSSFVVGQPSLLNCQVVVSPQYENGPMGNAQVLIEGGTAPYSISCSEGTINGDSITDLLAGQYNVLVTDENNCACSANFTIDWMNSLDEYDPAQFIIFPNPSDHRLTIYGNAVMNCDLRIMDITGKIVFHMPSSSNYLELNTSEWESGVYFIARDHYVQTLLIQH